MSAIYDPDNPCAHSPVCCPGCMRSRLGDCLRYAKKAEAERDEAKVLLRKCRPFVLRALNGVKVPHAQDKIDAEALWPLLKRITDR